MLAWVSGSYDHTRPTTFTGTRLGLCRPCDEEGIARTQ